MFTGIIEEQGRISRLQETGHSLTLTIIARKVLEDVQLGDSIAVNGICLTVTDFSSDAFSVDVMPETVKRTTVQNLTIGEFVNLERAMPAQGRFGGHIVQGHVDGIGTISNKLKHENAVMFTIRPKQTDLLDFMLPQGSIALDGVSLTLVEVEPDANQFRISMIPHTIQVTAFQYKSPGDTVNIECDILGKYVKQLLQKQAPGKSSSIDRAFLQQNGFL